MKPRSALTNDEPSIRQPERQQRPEMLTDNSELAACKMALHLRREKLRSPCARPHPFYRSLSAGCFHAEAGPAVVARDKRSGVSVRPNEIEF